jgi:RNA polymerase-interacting CarD/CdnL/TRCF family regulator
MYQLSTKRGKQIEMEDEITEALPQYTVGDWVVHHFYGTGQIKKIEEKPIHGEKVKCFRVKTKDGAFWFPMNQLDIPRIRPVAMPDTIQRAQKELQKTVRDLDPDRNLWKNRIDEVRASYDLIATSQMVRDLTILKTQRKSKQTEEKALNHFAERLISEWSATMKTDVETIRQQLNGYLRAIRERASV